MGFTVSSPLLETKLNSYNDTMKNKLYCNVYYYKNNYKKIIDKTGIEVSSKQVSLIFNSGTEKAYTINIEQEINSVDHKTLIGYLCKKSWENTRRAQRSGKKTIRYFPVVLKFATFIRSKMGKTAYNFLSSIYNLPSNSTINQYGTLDSNVETAYAITPIVPR